MRRIYLEDESATLPAVSLEQLVRFRGAMWPKLNLPGIPWGPRPGQLDNVTCIDYPEAFDRPTLTRIADAYQAQGFTHVPMGPMVDAGYHGLIPPCDFRGHFDAYLDLAEWWERRGVRVVHFLRPDEGCAGMRWDILDCQRILAPLFKSPRAQALMRIVVLGWEPGGKYGYNNDWWRLMLQWQANIFPRALRGLHTPPDQDAPTGQDDDVRGFTNGGCWSNVARFVHFWLVQNAGWTDTDDPVPSPEFYREFLKQFDVNFRGSYPHRFGGGFDDWPGYSAWGDSRGIIAIPAEYASYGLFWKNFSFEQACNLGEAAMMAGAIGFFDGGRVPK